MRACACAVVVAFCCAAAPSMAADQVLSGQDINKIQVSPDQWLNQSVVIEDTYEGIDQKFSKIETQNYVTPNMYVKFTLEQLPYPCIGQRSSIEKGLEKCSKGDLIRVTGDLVKIQQNRTLEKIEGKYDGGRGWDERVKLVGPLPSEYYFSVGQVEKGWGRNDSPEQMHNEGKNLTESQYRKVTIEQVKGHIAEYNEKAIQFEARFIGVNDSFSQAEQQAGFTPDKFLQFTVKGVEKPIITEKSPKTVAGFKEIPPGNKLEIYGRIRTKTTPAGKWCGFIADHVITTIRKQAEAKPGQGSASVPAQQQGAAALSPAGDAAAVAPPPPPGR